MKALLKVLSLLSNWRLLATLQIFVVGSVFVQFAIMKDFSLLEGLVFGSFVPVICLDIWIGSQARAERQRQRDILKRACLRPTKRGT